MLNNGVIEPSTSPWASPVVLVKKADGSTRFCVDYHRLNSCTVMDAHPLPRIDDTIDQLGGAKFFSTLDLQSGYWQVPMSEESRPKTAFTIPVGLFHFTRMPFGLINAPATFQRLMNTVLQGLNFEICLIYLDDVIVFSHSFAEHLERLRLVLAAFRKAGLKVKPRKCKLLCEEVPYLGFIVSAEGVSTNPSKTAAVADWPVPTSCADVRNFVGFASYYRRFIAECADRAAPLHALLEKG